MNKETKEILDYETKEYKHRKSIIDRIFGIFTKGLNSQLYCLLHYYRKYIYYCNENKNIILKLIYEKLYRKYAIRTNCEIYAKKIGKGLRLYHGGIIIGANTIIKENVKFHGHNCVGNNGFTKEEPVIGNNVNIGVGAVIIGNIELADNIVVGANSVVTKSFIKPGVVIAGNPARIIKESLVNEKK